MCDDDTEIDVFGLFFFIDGGSMLMNGVSVSSYVFYYLNAKLVICLEWSNVCSRERTLVL